LPGQSAAGTHDPVPVHVTSHAQELSQSTPPRHVLSAVQSISHRPGPQVIAPAQASAVPQPSVHVLSRPPQSMVELHDPAPVQPIVHAAEPAQLIAEMHDPAPVQVIPQLSVALQSIAEVHALSPQLRAQLSAALQSIVPVHDPIPVHMISHGRPGGQTIGSTHDPSSVQSKMQVKPLHELHTAGQTNASGGDASIAGASARGVASIGGLVAASACLSPIVQNPISQRRSGSHSLSDSQRKSADFVSIRQPL
jgi:hypothetical protein